MKKKELKKIFRSPNMQLIVISESLKNQGQRKQSKKYVKNVLRIETCVSRLREPTEHSEWGKYALSYNMLKSRIVNIQRLYKLGVEERQGKCRLRNETRQSVSSAAALRASRQGSNSVQTPKGNYFYVRILFAAKLSIMYEERIQLFSNMQNLKKKSPPTNPLDSYLKMLLFCSGKTNK